MDPIEPAVPAGPAALPDVAAGATAVGAPRRRRCSGCGGDVDPGTRHVKVSSAGVRLFCSPGCLAADGSRAASASDVAPEPRALARLRAGHVFVVGLGLAAMSPCGGGGASLSAGALAAGVIAPGLPRPAAEVAEEPRPLGPPAPDDTEVAQAFLAEIGGDRWVHPLPGPRRRMPARESRVFGAARDGDRPGECRRGHCGVDLGGEIWGEAVFAVHDGVAERVNRDPGRSGGMYVRLAHRDGQVFTQYFHLAAIPRALREGSRVRAGDVIGLVGDTGVDHSGAHLHFTISVRPEGATAEVHMDPEPLIALWPLKVITLDGTVAAWSPGAPLGAVGGRIRRARRARAAAPPAPSSLDTAASAAVASDPPAAPTTPPTAAILGASP